MLASAPAEVRARLSVILDENVDSVLTIFIPPLVTEPDAVALAIASVAPQAQGADPASSCARGRAGRPRVDSVLCLSGVGRALAPSRIMENGEQNLSVKFRRSTIYAPTISAPSWTRCWGAAAGG
jgi:hypothetical protein